MTFLSIGFCLYTGKEMYCIYPLNLILLPLFKLFGLDAPIFSKEVFDE